MHVPACGSWCAREGASSEAEPARGRRGPSSEGEPSSEAEPARGGVGPRARRNPLEGALALERGGTCSRGRLIGPLRWAAGATATWAVPCVRV
jgi:hypothetical protein